MGAEQIPFDESEYTMPLDEAIVAAPEAPRGSQRNQPLTHEEQNRLEFIARKFRPGLVRLAIGRGAPEPEDVVQEAMVRAARFENGVAWQYIRRTVINAIISESKSPRVRKVIAAEILETDVQTVDPAPAVEDSLLVRQILTQVDPISRELFLLRFYEDLTIAEIAERQGLPEGTVKARFSRALKKCRQVLAAE